MRPYQLFDRNTRAIVYGFQTKAVQRMLDFDYVCQRDTPSVACMVDPTRSTFRGTPPSCPLFCNNGSNGTDGNGACATDADCGGDVDSCQAVCDGPDTDGDGIPDHIEQRGWIVTVELTAREGLFDRRLAGSAPGLATTSATSALPSHTHSTSTGQRESSSTASNARVRPSTVRPVWRSSRANG